MKVWVAQWLNDALAFTARRGGRGRAASSSWLSCRSSSTNTSRCRSWAIRGWWSCRHSCRASATSARSASLASSVFLSCSWPSAGSATATPDRHSPARPRPAAPRARAWWCLVRLHPADQQLAMRRQLAATGRAPLPRRRQRARPSHCATQPEPPCWRSPQSDAPPPGETHREISRRKCAREDPQNKACP